MIPVTVDPAEVKATFVGDRFVKLVDELGGTIKSARRSTRDIRLPCFLHGGNGPNLVLTPAKGLWHCLSSCGGGDVFALVMRARGVTFQEALTFLADGAGLSRRDSSNVTNPRPEPGRRVVTEANQGTKKAREDSYRPVAAKRLPTRRNL